MRLYPADRAFDLQYAKNVVGTPGNPSAVESEETVWHDVPRAPVAQDLDPTVLPAGRRIILHKSYFEKFGYSANSPKCRALMKNDDTLAQRGQSDECRKRIEGEMEKDSILPQRLASARERMDRYMESEVKSGDKNRKDPAQMGSPAEAEVKPAVDQGQRMDDDGIPEVVEEDGEEVENPAKKSRTNSRSDEASAEKREAGRSIRGHRHKRAGP